MKNLSLIVDIGLIKAALFSLLMATGCEKSEPEPQVDAPSITSFSPEEGAIGTQVTISGANFSAVAGENNVHFDGKTAEVDAATATKLITSVPEGAATGKITITVNGITANSATDFLVKIKSDPSWLQKANLPVDNVTRATSFSVGGKGYFVTGVRYGTSQGTILPLDLWAYDPSSNTWTQKADFEGSPRIGAVGFAIGNKGYVGTGNAGGFQFLKDFWEYDPATNNWTKKKDLKGPVREDAVGFSIGNRGYIGTGNNNDDTGYYLNDFWEYNPEKDTWSQASSLPVAANTLILATGFSIGNKGYIGTGKQKAENIPGLATNKFWEYDPTKDQWTQKKDIGAEGRTRAVGFSIGNKGYIGTGHGPTLNFLSDFWEYDPAKDTWTTKIDLGGGARSYAFGFSIGNKGYIGGGYAGNSSNNNYFKDFWEYTP